MFGGRPSAPGVELRAGCGCGSGSAPACWTAPSSIASTIWPGRLAGIGAPSIHGMTSLLAPKITRAWSSS